MRTRICKAAAALLGLLLLGVAAQAQAQNYQITGHVNTLASTFAPGPREDQNHSDNFSWYDRPEARVVQSLSEFSAVSNGGYGRASLSAGMGELRALSQSYYPSGQPEPHYYGYSFGTAQATFADTVRVEGAGLAVGTPVRYQLHLWIDGSISSPSFEIGGHLSADGLAEMQLIDRTNNQRQSLSWDIKRHSTGWYSIALDTVVGHDLMVTGMLYAGASVDSSATLARYAESDFSHTARYFLQPSLAQLNTVGASGHDFNISLVPEPSAAWLLLAGLAVLGLLRGRRQPR